MTTVISSVALKGGVGKTTTIVGAALTAASTYNKKVCVIDLDEQGSASDALYPGHPRLVNAGASSAYNLIKSDCEIEPVHVRENLYLVHASLDLLALDNETIDVYFRLRDRIKEQLQDFDVVCIDTPGTIKTRVIAALIASQWFYSPIELAEYSVKSVDPLINQFKAVKANMNPHLNFAGMLPNRVHGIRNGAPIQVSEREIYYQLMEGLGGAEYLLGMMADRKYIRESLAADEALTGNAAEDAWKARKEIEVFTTKLLEKAGVIGKGI